MTEVSQCNSTTNFYKHNNHALLILMAQNVPVGSTGISAGRGAVAGVVDNNWPL